MGFLDNLENTLKAEESRQEREHQPTRKGQKQFDAERARIKAMQPLADELRSGKFASDLLGEATRIAHGLRTKVYITWIGSTLRLEAREHRLELTPTPDGIVATTLVNREKTGSELVDLKGSPKVIAQKWLSQVKPRAAPQPLPESE
jgi:hypothetical protein